MTSGRLKIGVFDSGFGGLTVLRALLPLLPQAEFIYLGDTARLPYGSKSRETISRYALSSAHFLQEQGADLLVIACNTASALALDEIREKAALSKLGQRAVSQLAGMRLRRFPRRADGQRHVGVLGIGKDEILAPLRVGVDALQLEVE